MKIIKEDKMLEVTEKAFKVVYKDLGYKPYNPDTHLLSYLEKEIDKVDEDKEIEEEVENIKSFDEITKDEIIERLKEKEIDHNPRDKKEILYNLLIEGD